MYSAWSVLTTLMISWVIPHWRNLCMNRIRWGLPSFVPRPLPDFISQLWRPDFSPRLRDKIWEWPEDEAKGSPFCWQGLVLTKFVRSCGWLWITFRPAFNHEMWFTNCLCTCIQCSVIQALWTVVRWLSEHPSHTPSPLPIPPSPLSTTACMLTWRRRRKEAGQSLAALKVKRGSAFLYKDMMLVILTKRHQSC